MPWRANADSSSTKQLQKTDKKRRLCQSRCLRRIDAGNLAPVVFSGLFDAHGGTHGPGRSPARRIVAWDVDTGRRGTEGPHFDRRLQPGWREHYRHREPRLRPCRPRRWPAVRRCVSEVRRWATQAASRISCPRLQQPSGWPDRRLVAEADWPRTSSRVRVQGAHAATQSWAGVDVMRTGRHPTRPSGGWQSDHLPPD